MTWHHPKTADTRVRNKSWRLDLGLGSEETKPSPQGLGLRSLLLHSRTLGSLGATRPLWGKACLTFLPHLDHYPTLQKCILA